ncbi:hypothetical protein LXA43DRAFT_633377 [Ganoderma leucocontextum]|nr:hypothetical protein LXA43DRAFT_633377 [Ganoderma leucocontextum]
MCLPHMSPPSVSTAGEDGAFLAPHPWLATSEVSIHPLLSFSSLPFSLCGACIMMETQRHTAWLTHHHHARCQPPVDGKPNWWQSTFAARRTQAPALAANHFTVAAKWRTSQRLSGTVACRGRATRIVRSRRVALQG